MKFIKVENKVYQLTDEQFQPIGDTLKKIEDSNFPDNAELEDELFDDLKESCQKGDYHYIGELSLSISDPDKDLFISNQLQDDEEYLDTGKTVTNGYEGWLD